MKNVAYYQKEFQTKQIDFNNIHDEMQTYLDGYEHNFFYRQKSNVVKSVKIGVNLVQVFADKLWHHTSELPKVSVPSLPQDDTSDIKEKIIHSTHQKNNVDLLWGEWTFDGSVMGAAVARTCFNVKKRCVEIQRYDPRRAYWQRSGNGELIAFWTAVPMTRDAIKLKYGKELTEGGASAGMTYDTLLDGEQLPIDEQDYFLVISRDDGEYSMEFVGNQWLKKPYKHLQGTIPVDVAIPYKTASNDNRPNFYISKFKDLQAEFNELFRRRSNVVRKLGNPLVYGRGIYKNNEQEIKKQMRSDGGFVPLKENGELALLTIPETSMIDNALADVFNRMKDVAGFPDATFGQVVGANTSGDALGMYFTPTAKMVGHYNKAYKLFLQGINEKILRSYYMFGRYDEEFTLHGYGSSGSVRTTTDGTKKMDSNRDGYTITFTKEDIGTNYTNVVTPASVTPKDDIAYKRFILDSVTNKFMSRRTGLDEVGILSPEDEFALLEEEQQNPMLNPDGARAVKEFDPMAGLEDENGQDPFNQELQPQQPLAPTLGG